MITESAAARIAVPAFPPLVFTKDSSTKGKTYTEGGT